MIFDNDENDSTGAQTVQAIRSLLTMRIQQFCTLTGIRDEYKLAGMAGIHRLDANTVLCRNCEGLTLRRLVSIARNLGIVIEFDARIGE